MTLQINKTAQRLHLYIAFLYMIMFCEVLDFAKSNVTQDMLHCHITMVTMSVPVNKT